MAAVAPAPRVSAPSTGRTSHPYTCNTCQVAFKGSDLQRTHMQSDWHRYNLKRRVASLPPLTSEIFAEKVLANQASAAATAAKAAFEKICAACQRTYFSENAYDNHLKSQKHKTRLAQLSNGHHDAETETETASMVSSTFSLGEPIPDVKPTPSETDDPIAEEEFAKVVDGIKDTSLDDDGDPIGRRPSRPHHSADPLAKTTLSLAASSSTATPLPTPSSASTTSEPTLSCLFCNDVLPDMEHNITHMSKTHGLFIPEQAYLVDLPGLLSYLHERVRILHECLYCGTTKYTTTGIQTHMRDKGHCMIAFDSEEETIEVGDFYDFTSTYSDEEDDEEDEDYVPPVKQGGVKLGAGRTATYTMMEEDGEVADDDDGWESDSQPGSVEDDESGDASMPDATPSRRTRPSNRAYQVDNELHLPSGRTAGHRSLAKYYRQNLHSYPSPAQRLQQQQLLESGEAGEDGASAQSDNRTSRGRQLAVSRADGGLGLLGATEAKKREARAIEVKDRKRVERQQNRYQWGNEKRGNMQKHFRDPLLQ